MPKNRIMLTPLLGIKYEKRRSWNTIKGLMGSSSSKKNAKKLVVKGSKYSTETEIAEKCRGKAISTPPFRRRRFGAGQLGAMPFRRSFLIFFYFPSYKKKK